MSDRLTGRTRYRVGWFGKLVLQVEYATREAHPGTQGRGTDWKWTGRAWRDARCEDFTYMHEADLVFGGRTAPIAGYQPNATPNEHEARPPRER